jgi:NADPH:quinone reductase-like Zn-dependent oxidoreductase
MRALVSERYGSPDSLRPQQVSRPEPGPDEVLVRVHAASVNSWNWLVRAVGKVVISIAG